MMAVFCVVLFFYSHKDEKHLLKSFIILNLVFTLPLIIFYYIPDYSGFDMTASGVNFYGDPHNVHSTYRLIGGETDLGVLVYFFLFFSVPFILIYYSFNDKLESKQAKSLSIPAEKTDKKQTQNNIKMKVNDKFESKQSKNLTIPAKKTDKK